MCHVQIANKTVTTKSFGYTSDKFREQRENPITFYIIQSVEQFITHVSLKVLSMYFYDISTFFV